MTFRHALMPGSYDPPTLGHLALLKRALTLADRVTLCAMVNPSKHTRFSLSEREALLRAATEEIPAAGVCASEGTQPQVCRALGCDVIVKGYRDEADLAYEIDILREWALANRTVYTYYLYGEDGNPVCHTVGREGETKTDVPPTLLLPCDPAYREISSTAARRAMDRGCDLSALLPPAVIRALAEHNQP